MRKILTVALAMLMIAGCRFSGPGMMGLGDGDRTASNEAIQAPAIAGRATFGRRIQASLEEVAVAATVSLIDTNSSQSVVSGITDASGSFTLNMPRGYQPDPGVTYFLEAFKGLHDNAPGHSAARVRTLLKFQGGRWHSLTNTTAQDPVWLNASTTAVAIGAALRRGAGDIVSYDELIGSLVSGNYATVDALTSGDVTAITGLIDGLLTDDRDPVRGVMLDAGTWKRIDLNQTNVSITAVTPGSAPPGARVVLTGTGFSPTLGGNEVRINGTLVPIVRASATELEVELPAFASSGVVTVKVGVITFMGDLFVVTPEVTGFTPASAVNVNQTFTIQGKGFGFLSAKVSATVGGVALTVLNATPTSLTVRAPNVEANGPVAVSVGGGTSTSTGSLRVFAGLRAGATIQTIAGTKTAPAGTLATAWPLEPTLAGLAFDAAGNGYFVGNQAVYKLTSDNRIWLVAGTGMAGYSGDTGPATSAQLSYPQGLALDAAGNLYIADQANSRIRRVDATTKVITTVAGKGPAFPPFGGDGELAVAASLQNPGDVAVDASGNLYIADTSNRCIRKVHAVTKEISTVAVLNYPTGIAVDGAGNLYVADREDHRILKIAASDGSISTVAGTGTRGFNGDNRLATTAELNYPSDVTIEADGTLLITDTFNYRIRRVDPVTKLITTFAGNGQQMDNNQYATSSGDGGQATSARLFVPTSAVWAPDGSRYVVDPNCRRIRRIGTDGVITAAVGDGQPTTFAGDGAAATGAILNDPMGIVRDGAGNLYVADSTNHRIRRIAAATKQITTYAGTGTAGFSGDGSAATLATLSGPSGLGLDATGNLYVADTQNHRIRRIDAVTKVITTIAGDGTTGASGDGALATSASLEKPSYLALDSKGNLYVSQSDLHRVRKIDAITKHISTVAGTGAPDFSGDGGSAISATLNTPTGLACAQDDSLYISDQLNYRIRKIDPVSSKIATVAGVGWSFILGDNGPATAARVYMVTDLMLDPIGNLYLLDSGLQRIRKIDTGGTITTVAGNGSPGYSGDGGTATAARVQGIRGLCWDDNALVFTDTEYEVIRRVQ